MSDVALGQDKPTSTIFTIGFTHKSSREFFETLQSACVKRVVDKVRPGRK